MVVAAKALQSRRAAEPWRDADAKRSLLAICGSLISVAGLAVSCCAALSAFAESSFPMSAGVALVVSGVLIARARRSGAFALMAISAATTVWTVSADHLGSASLVARLAGPLALLLVTALLLPPLFGIRPAQTFRAFAASAAVTIAIGAVSFGASAPLGRAASSITYPVHSNQRITS